MSEPKNPKPGVKKKRSCPATTPKGPGSRLRSATEAPGGRPGKARRLSPDELKVLGNMSMTHMTLKDMAHVLGLSETTLERMSSDDPIVSDAISKGRSEGQRAAHTWAFKKAFQGQGNVDMAKFWLRMKGGFVPPPVPVTFTGPDGVTAPRLEFVIRGGAAVRDALDEFIDPAQPDMGDEEEAS